MNMLDHALAYAQGGWPVFPCSPVNKAPLTPPSSGPGAKDGGLYHATTDEATIRGWWKRWPKAMIGVRTGAASGGFVVDLDHEKTEGSTADEMMAALGEWLGGGLAPDAVARTRSGGLHLWFVMPAADDLPGGELGNRAELFKIKPDYSGPLESVPDILRKGVDVRGDGGYVIVPPSVMESGQFYAWERAADLPLRATAPAKLLDVILKRGAYDPRKAEVKRGPAAAGSISDRAKAGRAGIDGTPQEKARKAYALKALDEVISNLRDTTKGSRGSELNKAAFSLGGIAGAGLLSQAVARAELYSACEANGLCATDGAQKVMENIRRGVADGMAKPIDISNIGTKAGKGGKNPAGGLPRDVPPASPAQGMGAAPDPSSTSDGAQPSQTGEFGRKPPRRGKGGLDLELSTLPLTDLGNAERFRRRHGADFLFVPEWGWLAYDGKRWDRAKAESLLAEAVHDTVKAIAGEARAMAESGRASEENPQGRDDIIQTKKDGDIVLRSDKVMQWWLSSQGNAHIQCIANLARPYLSAMVADFDADPLAINVLNGTLRAQKRDDGDYISFHEHCREDRISKLAPVIYDKDALCPVYDGFMNRVQPDKAMQRHLHAWGGVSLTALLIQMVSLWWGGGSNGKSTTIDAWHHVFGDYGGSVPIETFLDEGRSRGSGQATPDLAILPGLRSVRTSEPKRGAKLDEATIKQVTGGEPIKARHLNKDYFEFLPVFKLTISFNPKPQIHGAEHATWRRIILVPWEATISDAEKDADLPKKLRAEASGILNRILDGLRDYLDHGLMLPDAVKEATAQYRDESDPLRLFIEAAIEKAPGGRVQSTELFRVFQAWCNWAGQKEWTITGFSRAMSERGYVKKQSNTVQWLDIKLLKYPSDFPADVSAGDDDGRYPSGYGNHD